MAFCGLCEPEVLGETYQTGIRRTKLATAGSRNGFELECLKVQRALLRDVKERGKLDLTECFNDGTFVIAKKGAAGLEKPSGAKVQSS